MKIKYLIIAAIILLAVAIIVINLKPKPKDPVKAEAAKGSVSAPGVGKTTADRTKKIGVMGVPVNPTLKLRSGIDAPAEVKELQTLLNSSDLQPGLVVDGLFGEKTYIALTTVYTGSTITLEQAWAYFIAGYTPDPIKVVPSTDGVPVTTSLFASLFSWIYS